MKDKPLFVILGLNRTESKVVFAGMDNTRTRASNKALKRKVNGEHDYDDYHVFRLYDGTGREMSNWFRRLGFPADHAARLVREVGAVMNDAMNDASDQSQP